MEDKNIEKNILIKLKEKYSGIADSILLPPPIFLEMGGEILEYDETNSTIMIKFPLKYNYANPFNKMQGGVIAAAIDNTFGPLSMLAAPLNYTRTMEVKYKKQIDVNDDFIIVEAIVTGQKTKRLFLEAKVYDQLGCVMATANATNWIV